MESKFTENVQEFKDTLEEIQKSWDDICKAFGVDKDKEIPVSDIKRNLRTTIMELNEIENLDYVKKSNKPLENLHRNYVLSLIKFGYSILENKENELWADTIKEYISEIFTEDITEGEDLYVLSENVVVDELFKDIQRIFSIANQLNVIRIMETDRNSSDMFMALEDNFIYFGIGMVQKCNENAVIMAQVVTFLKVLIKINDNILKSISNMIRRP